MKKLLLVAALLLTTQAFSQILSPVKRLFHKPKYQFGVGVQYTYPFYSLSLKYALTQHSVFEGIAAPLSSGSYGLSYYGLRYVHRFSFISLPFLGSVATSYPYLFVGAGWLGWNYKSGEIKYSGTTPGYYLGAGYELILARHLAVSAEVAYGQVMAHKDSMNLNFTYTGGIHYYFGRKKGRNSSEGTAVMGNEPINEADNDENDVNHSNHVYKNDENDEEEESNPDSLKSKTNIRYKFGLGFGFSWPFYCISAKYAISQHSVIDVIYSPASTDYGLSFVGAKYIQRFWMYKPGYVFSAYPYLFAGGGYIHWSYKDGQVNYSGDAASYFGGLGYELVFGRHFAFSGEVGYGVLTASKNDAAATITYGGGFHYYFGKAKVKTKPARVHQDAEE